MTSHLEEIGEQAVAAGAATICDIIGNALADEAASIAAKWLRPTSVECREAKRVESTAFLICIRLGFTQARLWELTEEARRYEAPPEIERETVDFMSVFQATADEFALQGHDITEASQGKQSGHYCSRCTTFHAKHNFNMWLTGKPCKVKATGKERKAAFEANFSRKAKRLGLREKNWLS